MKWGGGEGASPSIAALRPPQAVVELTVTLPDISSIPEPHKLTVRQTGTGFEGMSQVERDYALRYLIDQVVQGAIRELRDKGVMRGGS